jgi:hypothetical protein
MNDILYSLEDEVVKIMKDHRAILAGGSLLCWKRNEPIKDYDFWFKSEEEFIECVNALRNIAQEVCITGNANTFIYKGKTIQLCRTSFGSAYDIISTFDFKFCQIALDTETDEYIKNHDEDTCYDLLEALNENYTRILDIKRAFKYANRGLINKESLISYLKDKIIYINTTKGKKDEFY